MSGKRFSCHSFAYLLIGTFIFLPLDILITISKRSGFEPKMPLSASQRCKVVLPETVMFMEPSAFDKIPPEGVLVKGKIQRTA